MNKPTTVDEYMGQFEIETRQRLEALRTLIREESPESTENLSYGLIGYKLNNRPLVYIGGFARHIGFYATPNGHEAFTEEFSKYKQGKGSVQFPLNKPLPIDLVRRVVAYRKEQVNKGT